jgi:MFS family permease
MQNAASGWLMTSLSPAPLDVALVQAAATLPMFLFSLPAGALADIVNRRRLLIVVQVAATGLGALFAALVGLGWVTPNGLLAVIFLSGVTTILAAPAWQAIVPQLVPHEELSPAVALNGVGFNISRAIGPALAGLAIAGLGMASPFWLNAASNVIAIAALFWWRAEPAAQSLPAERFLSAMRGGLRYARHNRHLRATLVRSAAFFPLASVYWALLPLLARQQIGDGPELYGILLGAIGTGAVAGAFVLPIAKARLGPDGLVAAATSVTAVALLLFAIARNPGTALVACALAGKALLSQWRRARLSGNAAKLGDFPSVFELSRDACIWIAFLEPRIDFAGEHSNAVNRIFVFEEAGLPHDQKMAESADPVVELRDLFIDLVRCTGEHETTIQCGLDVHAAAKTWTIALSCFERSHRGGNADIARRRGKMARHFVGIQVPK